MSDPQMVAEKVLATELPQLRLDLSLTGQSVLVRPRGAYGARFGNLICTTAYINPEPYTYRCDVRKITREYAAGETICVKYQNGLAIYPLTVSFRVFVK